MIKNITKIILLLLFFATIVKAQKKDGLIGRWETDVIQNSKVGSVWEFEKGGKISIKSGAIVDYVYTLTKDRLILALLNHITGKATVDTTFIKINGNIITQDYKIKGKHHKRKLYRISKRINRKKPLVGTWVTKNIAGQKSTLQFKGDQTLKLRIIIDEKDGSYNNEIDLLTLKLDDKKEYKFKIKFLNHTLILTDVNNGGVRTLHKLYD